MNVNGRLICNKTDP